jgi:hypothetical protein
MSRGSPVSRLLLLMASLPLRSSWPLFAALLLAAAPAPINTAQAAPAPVAQEQQAGPARPMAGDDTAIVHRELRKSIEKFQDNWRSVWKKVEVKRHNNINLSKIRGWGVRSDGIIEGPTWSGDRDAMNMTSELRRYLAILCNIDSPSDKQIEFIKARKGTDIGSRGTFKAEPLGENAFGSASTLRAAGFQSELSFLSPRIITPSPNYGAICPAWIPADERLPLDEGEAIDLALPPASREPLRREREVLITTLANAKARYPNDEWITGQHFRFVLDQRSPTRALEAARACKGSDAFCSRLLGLALDAAGQPLEAESSYRNAVSLEINPTNADTATCIHAETLMLLRPGDRDQARRAPCSEQRVFVERLWWLADPLWSIPGNERYTAHESRRTHATLRAVLPRDERYTWARLGGGEAFRELIVRYGWPGYTYWPGNQLEEEINKVRENPARPRFVFPPYTAVEYSSDRTALIPAVDAIRDPFNTKPSHWDLRLREASSIDQWWPQEHMMLWTQLHALEPGQQAQWRRDSTVVFGMVVDNPLFSLDTSARGPSTAALVASTNGQDIRVLWKSALGKGEVLRMRGEFPSQPQVLSAEIHARTPREPAQRLRFGMHPVASLRDMKPGEVAISEPVFLQVESRDAVLPNNLEAATLFMAGTLDFARTDQLALFWESYGFAANDSVQFELRVNRNDDVNLARRLGSALGIASALRDSVSIRWTEPDARNGASVLSGVKPIVGRSVALDLKALPPGSYVVSIEMRGGNGAVARNERKFVLR